MQVYIIYLNNCFILGFGYCPYNEVMAFMSLATSGAYLPRVPEIRLIDPYVYEMNQYHEVVCNIVCLLI